MSEKLSSLILPIKNEQTGQNEKKEFKIMVKETNKEPYVSRTARDGLVKIPQLIGATVAWNQLVSTVNVASEVYGIARTLDTSTEKLGLHYTGTSTNTTSFTTCGIPAANIVLGHKYYVTLGMDVLPSGCTVNLIDSNKGIFIVQNVTTSWNGTIGVKIESGTTVDFTVYPNITDLTQMFGTAIADYIYSLEQATEGSGLAWLKSYGFFTKDYYEYDAGSLQSVCTSARKITALDGTVRTYPIDNEELRGLFKLDTNNKLYCDGDIYKSNGAVTRKYGIVDLGTLTWAYNNEAGHYYFTAQASQNPAISDIKAVATNDVVANMLCGKYVTRNYNTIFANIYDKSIALAWLNWIGIQDSAYTDAETFKTAMSGVYLVYELAEETTFSADPYINPQRSEGTEEFVDGLTRDVMVPVGNESTYYLSEVLPSAADYTDGQVAGLESGLADTDNMIASQWLPTATYTKNSIVRDDEHLYKAKSDVPVGTVTSNTTYWGLTNIGEEITVKIKHGTATTSDAGIIPSSVLQLPHDSIILRVKLISSITDSLIGLVYNNKNEGSNQGIKVVSVGLNDVQGASITYDIFYI